jgi:hypothetical protein
MRAGCCLLTLALLAPWPGQAEPPADPSSTATHGGHWAFQPIRAVAIPQVRNPAWCRNPIDRFLLSAMETHGLSPAPAATPEQLLRRVTLGLTGMPAGVEELDALISSPDVLHYERLVERQLGSPHYGERWARHWLDLARYAESDGFEHDAPRPASWRYRDYVIQAFNQDKPYDRFLREQIAGDELWPDLPEARIATGFNLLGPDMVDSADQTQRRLNTLNDMTDTTAAVVLGLTLGCARCHDHKFEPFTQRDYYQLEAFYAPAEFKRDLPVPNPGQRAAYEEALAAYQERTRTERDAIAALERPIRLRLFEQKLAALSEDAQLAHRTPKEQRTKEQEGTVQETAPMVAVTETEVEAALSSDDRTQRKALLKQIDRVPKPAPMPLAMGLQNASGTVPATYILVRGDYTNPRDQVEPGFPQVLPGLSARPSAGRRSGRAALADWLTSPANPLTARVMANRIWQHHFGRGLVSTPSDFGTRGALPSHPELLDWLAGEFIRSGWSIKAMHRLILGSAAYCQSSSGTAVSVERDPENRWLSRQNRTRLEGEILRDSLLAVSGRLNPAQGGPSVQPPIPADLAGTSKAWVTDTDPGKQTRRSIYVFSRRNLRFPFLEAFDAPDNNLPCPERGRSTTAPQALTLLNSREVMDAAAATARRVTAGAKTTAEQIGLAHRLILGRAPTEREQALADGFLRESRERLEQAGDNPAHAAEGALKELCRAWFNLNSFVYVE